MSPSGSGGGLLERASLTGEEVWDAFSRFDSLKLAMVFQDERYRFSFGHECLILTIESRRSTVGAIQTVNGGFTPSSAGRGIAIMTQRPFIGSPG